MGIDADVSVCCGVSADAAASERRLVEGETCSSEGEACPGRSVVSKGKFASRTGTWRGAMVFVESWWASS